jgi:hypothetical protein
MAVLRGVMSEDVHWHRVVGAVHEIFPKYSLLFEDCCTREIVEYNFLAATRYLYENQNDLENTSLELKEVVENYNSYRTLVRAVKNLKYIETLKDDPGNLIHVMMRIQLLMGGDYNRELELVTNCSNDISFMVVVRKINRIIKNKFRDKKKDAPFIHSVSHA